MNASTPAGNPAANTREDRHGDVDRNGDLVDKLDDRLRGAITAVSSDLAEQQLAAVRQVVRSWTVR